MKLASTPSKLSPLIVSLHHTKSTNSTFHQILQWFNLRFVLELDDFCEMFAGTGTSHNITDSSLKHQRASDVFSRGNAWNLGIMDKHSNTGTINFIGAQLIKY
jgi:hypothetical protein